MSKNKEFVKTILIAVILSIFIRFFIIETVIVEGDSMLDTIESGDRVIAVKTAKPDKGDVAIIRIEDSYLIKRVIATEGDTIKIEDGVLYLNGEKQEEKYIKERMQGNFEEITLEKGEFFAMGDNRNYSLDSRHLGPFNEKDFIGQGIIHFDFWDTFKIIRK